MTRASGPTRGMLAAMKIGRMLPGAALALATALTAGCSSQPATTPQASTPATTPNQQAPVCPKLTAAGRAPTTLPVLASAALLSAEIVVQRGSDRITCTILKPGETDVLTAGQQVEFVANRAPGVSGANTSAVSVTTAPGPTNTGPGGLASAHVVVTVTAVSPGTVKLAWTDCSGTAC